MQIEPDLCDVEAKLLGFVKAARSAGIGEPSAREILRLEVVAERATTDEQILACIERARLRVLDGAGAVDLAAVQP